MIFFPFLNTFFSKKMNVMLMNFYQQFPTIHNNLVTAPSCLIMPFKCTLAFGLKLVHLLPTLLRTVHTTVLSIFLAKLEAIFPKE